MREKNGKAILNFIRRMFALAAAVTMAVSPVCAVTLTASAAQEQEMIKPLYEPEDYQWYSNRIYDENGMEKPTQTYSLQTKTFLNGEGKECWLDRIEIAIDISGVQSFTDDYDEMTDTISDAGFGVEGHEPYYHIGFGCQKVIDL